MLEALFDLFQAGFYYPHDIRIGNLFLFLQLFLVHFDLFVQFFQGFLQDQDILTILL